jgi:signal peptide peptidase SppA
MSTIDIPDSTEGAERRPSRYPNVAKAVFETPWAIIPSRLAAIVEVVTMRIEGHRFSEDEIAERIGSGPASRASQRQGAVAVIPIYGVIMPRADFFSQISGGTSLVKLASQLQQSVDDPQVGSILLDIDSPGGSVALVAETAALIRAANAKKPVTAVANTMAASAAYHLASQAGEIVASPSALLGSIGVFNAHEDFSGMEEKLGIKTTIVRAGKYKAEGNEHEPLTAEAQAAMQSLVDAFYDGFVADVAKGRGVSVADVRNGFGEGRVVTAKDAVRLGMADRVATFDATLAQMARGGSRPGSRAVAIVAADELPDEEIAEPDASADELADHQVDEAQAGPDTPERAELNEDAMRLLAHPGVRRAYSPKEEVQQ